MDSLAALMPRTDYDAIRAAIAYLSEHGPDEADWSGFAARLGFSERQLTGLFRRWCGLSPKSFAQAVTIDHARRLLRDSASLLDATHELGLSSAARLYDLFVTHEAMPPGVWRERGAGLVMQWGVAPTPFGDALLFTSRYGLAGIGFVDEAGVDAAFRDLAGRWPRAEFVRDDAGVRPLAARAFDPQHWQADRPIKIILIGTDFEVRVWETLLRIPVGGATTYGAIARHLGQPTAARAVGAAVGRNPLSFVVPCHRVVGASGELTGYHWGVARKRAMLGWEAGQLQVSGHGSR